MNWVRPTKYCIHILSILIMLLAAACGRSERSPEAIVKVPPLPSGTPLVAYGASLSEWEEAAQSNGDQTVSSTDGRSGVPQSVSPLAPVSPLATQAVTPSQIGVPFKLNGVVYREIRWEVLTPADFSAAAIMAKFGDQLNAIEDGSPEASELYSKMQAELSSAPVNELLDETLVRLPGFIAPLNYTEDLITEFLLVPYFGACIHVPPPPVNQTVLVKAAEGQGINAAAANYPYWVMGKLTVEGATTEIGSAGYYIQDAMIELYRGQ